MSDTFYTYTLECTFECGAKIEVTDKHPGDKCDAAAEALGWATFDVPNPKKQRKGQKSDTQDVVCPDCIEKVRAIYHQVAGPELEP